MQALFFYLFAVVTVSGAIGVIVNRNPVSSAFSMIVCFLGVAAIFITLNAYLIGVIQILVYAGAIMVLFLFIIMLLDVQAEEKKKFQFVPIGVGSAIAIGFVTIVSSVLNSFEAGKAPLKRLSDPDVNDVKAIGQAIFTDYNFPLQIIGALLLVATVGVVILSKRELN
ncbi:MAG: NADH-quinone oxidoreductase subunit J [Verrucomicrobiales bacterium]|jgi:NADH-quinone oxidoreductase subunit J